GPPAAAKATATPARPSATATSTPVAPAKATATVYSPKIGDKIIITAAYAGSAYDKKAPNLKAMGTQRVLMRYYPGAAYPWSFGDGKVVTGFAKAAGFRKV
ncbi:MAG: hypothetical protein LBJ12_00945, partial [Oscillospiraceae bacterium]|nr:hypothetical protein [Oscillospiraceae bacterium]